MVLPLYATTRDVQFRNILEDVIVINTAGSPQVETLIVWDHLSVGDQQLVIDLINQYGGSIPVSPTAGSQEIQLTPSSQTGSPVLTGLNPDRTYRLAVTYTTATQGSPQGSPLAPTGTFDDVASFQGSDALTFSSLVTELNSKFNTVIASWNLGGLIITHPAAGERNNIQIDDSKSNLFPVLSGFNGFAVPQNGVDDTLGVFAQNRIFGSLANEKIPLTNRGSAPLLIPGNDTTKAYYDGTNWVRWIDGGTVSAARQFFDFAGTAFAETANTITFSPDTQAFTYRIKFRRDSTGGIHHDLINFDGQGIRIRCTSTSILELRVGSTSMSYATIGITVGTPYQLTVVSDGTTTPNVTATLVALDSSEVDQNESKELGNTGVTAVMSIGRNPTGGNYFQGLIWDVELDQATVPIHAWAIDDGPDGSPLTLVDSIGTNDAALTPSTGTWVDSF